jgi:hypothetical protein
LVKGIGILQELFQIGGKEAAFIAVELAQGGGDEDGLFLDEVWGHPDVGIIVAGDGAIENGQEIDLPHFFGEDFACSFLEALADLEPDFGFCELQSFSRTWLIGVGAHAWGDEHIDLQGTTGDALYDVANGWDADDDIAGGEKGIREE